MMMIRRDARKRSKVQGPTSNVPNPKTPIHERDQITHLFLLLLGLLLRLLFLLALPLWRVRPSIRARLGRLLLLTRRFLLLLDALDPGIRTA